MELLLLELRLRLLLLPRLLELLVLRLLLLLLLLRLLLWLLLPRRAGGEAGRRARPWGMNGCVDKEKEAQAAAAVSAGSGCITGMVSLGHSMHNCRHHPANPISCLTNLVLWPHAE